MRKLATLITTEKYEAQISSLLGLDEQSQLEFSIAAAPEAHPIIPDTGGVRKARWSRPGMGKRGGVRVIYYWATRAELVVLLTAYPKSVKENLSDADKRAIRKAVEGLKKDVIAFASGERHHRRTK